MMLTLLLFSYGFFVWLFTGALLAYTRGEFGNLYTYRKDLSFCLGWSVFSAMVWPITCVFVFFFTEMLLYGFQWLKKEGDI